MRAWREAHPERTRELYRNHYHANREKINGRNRAYAERNHEQLVINSRARVRRRRAILANAPGMFTEQEFQAVCLAFEMRCAYCHAPAERLTPDHMTPLARGGSNDIDNIIPACLSCNAAKQARTPLEFIASQSGFARMMGTL